VTAAATTHEIKASDLHGAAAPANSPSRNAGLDSLRGIAALSVFFFHAWLYNRAAGEPGFLGQAANQARVGVICFFVLSGFLLYRPFIRAARRQTGLLDLGAYAARRATRIFPAYWLCLLIVYPLMRIAEGYPGVRLPAADDVWLFGVMGQNFSSDTLLKLNSVTWTLPIELAFYASLPLLGWLAYRVAGGRFGVQVLFVLGLAAAGLAWKAWNIESVLGPIHGKALPTYLPFFAAGMLTALGAEWLRSRDREQLGRATTAALVIAGVALVVGAGVWHANGVATGSSLRLALTHELPYAIGYALLTLAVAMGVGHAVDWAHTRPLAYLGAISYGVYLWQVPVILFLGHLGVGGAGEAPVVVLVALPVTLACAAASWHAVEQPLLKRVQRRTARAPGRPVAAAVTS